MLIKESSLAPRSLLKSLPVAESRPVWTPKDWKNAEDPEYCRQDCYKIKSLWSHHPYPMSTSLASNSPAYKFKVILQVFKCVNGIAPAYLQDIIHPRQQSRSLRSSCQQLLDVPFTRHSGFAEQAFKWCGRPMPVERITTTYAQDQWHCFKSTLRTFFLFNEHFMSNYVP